MRAPASKRAGCRSTNCGSRQVWAGEVVLLRAERGHCRRRMRRSTCAGSPALVLQERRSLRDIGLASLTLSFLTIFPPLLVMTMVEQGAASSTASRRWCCCPRSWSSSSPTKRCLGYARRLIISVVGARLDAKLNLHVFNRLLRLPLDYFERHPAGETMYQIAQVYRIREFLTGKLLTTFLDLITLCRAAPVPVLSECDPGLDRARPAPA